MRAVQHHEALGRLRLPRGEGPGHRAAPVVADDDRALPPEVADEPQHVGRQQLELVAGHAFRLVALTVAAQVRRDDLEALGQGRDLAPPGVPELREAVQQHDERALACRHVVEAHFSGLREAVLPALYVHRRFPFRLADGMEPAAKPLPPLLCR